VGVPGVSRPERLEKPRRALFLCQTTPWYTVPKGELLYMCWIMGFCWRPLERLEKSGGCGIDMVW